MEDGPGYEYQLQSYGAFSPVSLGDAELEAAAFLSETFAPGGHAQAEAVQALLRRVLDWVPVGQRSAVGYERAAAGVDLRRRDDDVVHPRGAGGGGQGV